jgi:hypothetical protein
MTRKEAERLTRQSEVLQSLGFSYAKKLSSCAESP